MRPSRASNTAPTSFRLCPVASARAFKMSVFDRGLSDFLAIGNSLLNSISEREQTGHKEGMSSETRKTLGFLQEVEF
jgi:hypothetical protein